MVEFKGYINGEAEKFFQYNNRIFGVKLLFFACLMIAPSIIIWGFKAQNWLLVGMCAACFLILPLFALIPQSQKNRRAMTPKSIVLDVDFITCKTEKFGETKYIGDVKLVKDHGDFYELVFPFGKVSKNFICQKDLLSEGTLEEFEAAFEGKIKRLGKNK